MELEKLCSLRRGETVPMTKDEHLPLPQRQAGNQGEDEGTISMICVPLLLSKQFERPAVSTPPPTPVDADPTSRDIQPPPCTVPTRGTTTPLCNPSEKLLNRILPLFTRSEKLAAETEDILIVPLCYRFKGRRGLRVLRCHLGDKDVWDGRSVVM
jgi:hypothetical protein